MADGVNPGDPGPLNPGLLGDPKLNLIINPEELGPVSISEEGTAGYIPRVPLPQVGLGCNAVRDLWAPEDLKGALGPLT